MSWWPWELEQRVAALESDVGYLMGRVIELSKTRQEKT
jgi:hypothetical protein